MILPKIFFRNFIHFQTPPLEIVQSTFDILTFVVPPSLPACMTLANYLAQRRLKRNGIFCLSSKYINQAGNINVVAFDKVTTRFDLSLTESQRQSLIASWRCPANILIHFRTSLYTQTGTLTKDGLDLQSILSVQNGR